MTEAGGIVTGRRVILLGGTSEIGLAIVRELLERAPREVVLVGRDEEALTRAAALLREAGAATADTVLLDARRTERHGEALDRAFAALGGGADIVILAVGVLGERGGLPSDLASAVEVLEVNAVASGALLIGAASRLREHGGGAVVVLSSVAAERPRRANAVYGASKAAIDSLACALGDALHDDGVHVLVVRPGFVHTRMTRGLQAAPLATDARSVASRAVDALAAEAQIVWAPSALRWLMLVLRMLPRPLFRRISQ